MKNNGAVAKDHVSFCGISGTAKAMPVTGHIQRAFFRSL
jgi:hypothetical protein